MFLRNAVIAAGNSRLPSLREPLARLLQSQPGDAMRELIQWALERIEIAGVGR